MFEPKQFINENLLKIIERVYKANQFKYSELSIENESLEYGACKFKLNNLFILFRVAKITPTKTGQFVTLWKRSETGPIAPYDNSDEIDVFVVCARQGENFGQFVFPKSILYEKDIVSKEGKGGKRAIRVYPPWDTADNPQARRTQAWQLKYFLEIPFGKDIDCELVKRLYAPF